MKKIDLDKILQHASTNINSKNKFKITNVQYAIEKEETLNDKSYISKLIDKYMRDDSEDLMDSKLTIDFTICNEFKGNYTPLKNISKVYNLKIKNDSNYETKLQESFSTLFRTEVDKFSFEKVIQDRVNVVNRGLKFDKKMSPYDVKHIGFKKDKDNYIVYSNTNNNSKVDICVLKYNDNYRDNLEHIKQQLTKENINESSKKIVNNFKNVINSRTDNEVNIAPNESVRMITNSTIVETEEGVSVSTNVEYNIENRNRSIEHNQVLGQEMPMVFDMNYIFAMNQIEEIKEESESEYEELKNNIEEEYEQDSQEEFTRQMQIEREDEMERQREKEKENEAREKEREEFNMDGIVDFSADDFMEQIM